MTTTETIDVPAAGTYRMDAEKSTLDFTTTHLFGLAPVRGTFALREGVVRVGEPAESSTVSAMIAADSFTTSSSARDKVVASKQYLDAARHPDIAYAADGVERDESGWVLRGALTVRGRTESLPVRVDAVRARDERLELRGSAEVDRYAWGVTAMKGMTGRRLRFTLSLVAVREPQQ
ncbi:YceI family protein [Saccharomonospora piscinae]|uniref:YceI family protein n=1 Tax=Saccharomonospora piscinae TaxID=687388 RepID=UPI001106DFCF|nr:YceI family protein [Saccharomonospora piscinae]TLW94721.1 YceI family protein [Saccharomonospora piscinae]